MTPRRMMMPRRQRDDNAATTTTATTTRRQHGDNDGAKARLVVIPELQGLGLGRRLSEAVAQTFVERGVRYFSKARARRARTESRPSLPIERGSARADLRPSPPSTTRVSCGGRAFQQKDGLPPQAADRLPGRV